MSGMFEKTKWLVQGHNRFWDPTTNYAKQNGGKYEFEIDRYALPLEQVFWDELLRDAKQWGLTVYEQDWMYNELNHVSGLTQSATLGQQWLNQMATAADKNDLTIQYCMSYPRHIMATIDLPAVTQARASGM